MSEQCPDILRCDPQDLRQAMSIHTRKITDACRDKDCVEDLRVYLTAGSQRRWTVPPTCGYAVPSFCTPTSMWSRSPLTGITTVSTSPSTTAFWRTRWWAPAVPQR